MELGPLGVWSRELRTAQVAVAAAAAAGLAELGYSAAWLPGRGRSDVVDLGRAVLAATDTMVLATGVLSVWDVPAARAADTHADLVRYHPGRFVLGLGVSHARLVDRTEPGRYRRPLAAMRSYLDALDSAPAPVPTGQRVLAALGPAMLDLARDRAAGAHPYLTWPEHTSAARHALGAGPLLVPEQAVVLETDRVAARTVARDHIRFYLGLPNYVNNWRRLGMSDEDLVDGGSDRLVDALVAWGGEETVVRRLREHLDAGADQVAVQVLGAPAGDLPVPGWRRVAEAFAG